jgi:hypothetical protein
MAVNDTKNKTARKIAIVLLNLLDVCISKNKTPYY